MEGMPVYSAMSIDRNLDGRDRGSIPAVLNEMSEQSSRTKQTLTTGSRYYILKINIWIGREQDPVAQVGKRSGNRIESKTKTRTM